MFRMSEAERVEVSEGESPAVTETPSESVQTTEIAPDESPASESAPTEPAQSAPELFADDFQKTLENSPEWQEMEKSLKATLQQFNITEKKEVVDIPLIKRKHSRVSYNSVENTPQSR